MANQPETQSKVKDRVIERLGTLPACLYSMGDEGVNKETQELCDQGLTKAKLNFITCLAALVIFLPQLTVTIPTPNLVVISARFVWSLYPRECGCDLKAGTVSEWPREITGTNQLLLNSAAHQRKPGWPLRALEK